MDILFLYLFNRARSFYCQAIHHQPNLDIALSNLANTIKDLVN